MRFFFTQGQRLKFQYLNWRGNEHKYVVDVEELTWGAPENRWYLSGQVVTRDGDSREEMGPNRRRSFHVEKVLHPEVVE